MAQGFLARGRTDQGQELSCFYYGRRGTRRSCIVQQDGDLGWKAVKRWTCYTTTVAKDWIYSEKLPEIWAFSQLWQIPSARGSRTVGMSQVVCGDKHSCLVWWRRVDTFVCPEKGSGAGGGSGAHLMSGWGSWGGSGWSKGCSGGILLLSTIPWWEGVGRWGADSSPRWQEERK